MADQITEIRDAVTKLKALLDDPEPGLFTWHEMVRRRLEQLAAFVPSRTTPGGHQDG